MADESFVKEAIKTPESTKRMIALIGVTAALLLVVVAAITIAIVYSVDYLAKSSVDYMAKKGFDIQYSAANGMRLCSPGGKSLTVVDVPAYQLGVPSGVRLKKGSKITFAATGMVSTLTSVDCYDMMKANTLEALQTALLKLFHQQTFHLDWRGPDGTLLYVKSPERPGSDCQINESERMKICPSAEWGCLLAFVMPKGQYNPGKVLAKIEDPGKQILKIGRGTVLEYKDGRFVGQNADFSVDDRTYGNCEIFFTVNDIVIHDKKDLFFPNCKQSKDKITSVINSKQASYYDECCDRMKDPQPYGIWYLDNRGSFTVSILEENT